MGKMCRVLRNAEAGDDKRRVRRPRVETAGSNERTWLDEKPSDLHISMVVGVGAWVP